MSHDLTSAVQQILSHECDGPPALFKAVDHIQLRKQCMFCRKPVGNAIRKESAPWAANASDDSIASIWDLRERSEHMAAFKAIVSGGKPFVPQSYPPSLVAYAEHVRKNRYRARLSRPDWQMIRKSVIGRANGRCESCGVQSHVDVHHLHYRTFGRESLADVAALCRRCHDMTHEDHTEVSRAR